MRTDAAEIDPKAGSGNANCTGLGSGYVTFIVPLMELPDPSVAHCQEIREDDSLDEDQTGHLAVPGEKPPALGDPA